MSVHPLCDKLPAKHGTVGGIERMAHAVTAGIEANIRSHTLSPWERAGVRGRLRVGPARPPSPKRFSARGRTSIVACHDVAGLQTEPLRRPSDLPAREDTRPPVRTLIVRPYLSSSLGMHLDAKLCFATPMGQAAGPALRSTASRNGRVTKCNLVTRGN